MPTPISISNANASKSQELRRLTPAANTNSEPFIKLWTLDELEALPDPQWLIDGILPEDGFAVLYGPPGSKKSFIALDWASSIATGTLWHGRKVKSGDVVYIYAEGKTALKLRNRAWQENYGQKPERLRFVNQAVDISTPAKVRNLIASIHANALEPQLIIIDTLARNFGSGDESSAKDMNAFVAGADRLRAAFPGCTVLVIHHTGKDKRKGARGSSVLNGAEDTAIVADSLAEGKHGHIECKKQKDSDCFGTIAFELVPKGKSAVLEWAATTAINSQDSAQKQRTPMSEVAIMRALELFPDGATFTELKSAAKQKARTFADAINRLKNKGKITHNEASGLYKLGAV